MVEMLAPGPASGAFLAGLFLVALRALAAHTGQLSLMFELRDGASEFSVVRNYHLEFMEQLAMYVALESEDRILQLGANRGTSCIYGSRLLGSSQVVCVEPNRMLWGDLKRNREWNSNHFDIVEGVVAASCDPNTTFSMRADKNSLGDRIHVSRLGEMPSNDYQVPCHTISNVSAQSPERPLTVLFADCEGCLEDSFASAWPWRAVIYERDWKFPSQHEAFRDALLRAGLKPVGGLFWSGHVHIWLRENDAVWWSRLSINAQTAVYGVTQFGGDAYWIAICVALALALRVVAKAHFPRVSPDISTLAVNVVVLVFALLTLGWRQQVERFWTTALVIAAAVATQQLAQDSARVWRIAGAVVGSIAGCAAAMVALFRGRDWKNGTIPSPATDALVLRVAFLCFLAANGALTRRVHNPLPYLGYGDGRSVGAASTKVIRATFGAQKSAYDEL